MNTTNTASFTSANVLDEFRQELATAREKIAALSEPSPAHEKALAQLDALEADFALTYRLMTAGPPKVPNGKLDEEEPRAVATARLVEEPTE
jgi:hypothetical protein